jgi:autotransporter adhesin
MATAGLPQAYLPGKSMFSLAGGTWRGESGYAMGLSTVSDNGKWVIKGTASGSSRGDYGGSVGVGYQW